ncbi:carboxymuconolactone decarboxylase family protein [Mycobacterium sp. ZZG]
MRLPRWALLTATLAATSMWAAACAEPDRPGTRASSPADAVAAVSPALAHYTDTIAEGELWARPAMSARDRSVVTLAALIARNATIDLPAQLNRALDNGVSAAEISEIITHLAFYAGWPNAQAAASAAAPVFADRGVEVGELPEVGGPRLPIDQDAEDARRTTNDDNFGAVAPGVLHYTTDTVFTDLWLRPGLAPRDRSLVTFSALVAAGQTGQITYHLGRAMDNGLTQEQASEALTQLAFYAGWPPVFSALPVVKDLFAARAR